MACSVKISALALLKMAMHAKSGGNLEIMGMLQGKIVGNTFLVLDAFALPVEGTETRVNAQAEAYEFMIDFAESNKVPPPPSGPPTAMLVKLEQRNQLRTDSTLYARLQETNMLMIIFDASKSEP
jgi:hypothetical protein